MKLISVNALKIGELLSSDIRASNGNMLLKRSTILTEQMITRLKHVGIYSVYVEDDMFDDVLIRLPVEDETKARILGSLEPARQGALHGRNVHFESFKDLAREIFEEVRIASHEPINMINTFAIDTPISIHSVNVAIITAALAVKSQVRPQLAENYVLAALMHDIFITDLKDDNDGVYEHANKVYTALKGTGHIDAGCYMAASMHHERFDGRGGPRKIAGKQINEGGRFIAVADLFDNVINGYAGYNRLENYQAVEYLASQVNSIIDPDVFKVFQSTIAIYPTGATVSLNNGKLAAVIRQNAGMPARPVVKVLSPDKDERVEIDMLKNVTIFIDKVAL